MKKQQVLMLAIFLLALLTTTGVNATVCRSSKTAIEVFINDHLVNASKDSLDITAKGTLRLTGISDQSEQPGLVKFRIQIRHRTSGGAWQLVPYVEEYLDGKRFSTLKLEELMSNVKPGDQIVLIPVEDTTKYENCGERIVLNVTSNRC